MAWFYLLLASAFEIGFASSMKLADGFTKLWPSVIIAICTVGGIGSLTLAMRDLPVSVAYPIWTGFGAVGTVLIGTMYFGESMGLLKGLSIVAIVGGIIGLKLSH
jgi:quaternary ammonium compound-resistance protein SugE